jgi:hypothetical protein
MWLLIYAYPLANIIVTSFCNWNYKNFTAPEFPGVAHMFDNYIKLFTLDNNFKMGLINSVILTLVVQVPFTLLVVEIYKKRIRYSQYYFFGGNRPYLYESVQPFTRNRDGNLQFLRARQQCQCTYGFKICFLGRDFFIHPLRWHELHPFAHSDILN